MGFAQTRHSWIQIYCSGSGTIIIRKFYGVHGLSIIGGFFLIVYFIIVLLIQHTGTHGSEKLNRIESAQKIHASRGSCQMHAYQFLVGVASPVFQRYCYFQIRPNLKVAIFPKLEKPHSPKLVCIHVTSIPNCIIFLSQFRLINFLNDHGYSPWVEREIWPFLKVVISPKPKRLRPPKLVYMYVTSTSTCMIFLSRF